MLRGLVVGLGALALVVACGDDDDDDDVGMEPDGGVLCGAGTRPDGAGGCVASSLPSDQRSCLGRFGPIAEDAANTLYVDGSYTGGGSDGSSAAPYTAIQTAVDAAGDGDVVAVASGTYDEDVDIGSPLALEGRCAREVVIDGTVTITSGETSIQGVTVTNGAPGIQLSGSLPGVGDTFGTTIGTSIIEMNGLTGIQVEASSLNLDFSEVRLTQAAAGSMDIAEQGSGIYAFDGSFVRVANSIIEMNGGQGIDFADATGTIDTFVTGGTSALVATPRTAGIIEMNIIEMNGLSGVRIYAYSLGDFPDPASPRVSVLSNQIAGNGEHGVSVQETVVDISGNDFDGNGGSLPDLAYAVAINLSRASVTGNAMSGTVGGGVYLGDSQGAVAGNTIGEFPVVGVALVNARDGGAVANNVITGVSNVGIYVFEANDVIIDGNDVSATQTVTGADGFASGHGIFVTGFGDVIPEFVDIRNNYVHDNEGSGITLGALLPSDGTEPLYLVTGNLVERNANVGINVQNCGDGDLMFNDVIDNERFGIRGVRSAAGAARLRAFGNLVTGTVSTSLLENGDGIAMIGSHVGIGDAFMGNNVQDAARAGILFTGTSSGFCNSNQVGDIDPNGAYDILAQGAASTAMATSGNSLGSWGETFLVGEIEVVDGSGMTTQPIDKPLEPSG